MRRNESESSRYKKWLLSILPQFIAQGIPPWRFLAMMASIPRAPIRRNLYYPMPADEREILLGDPVSSGDYGSSTAKGLEAKRLQHVLHIEDNEHIEVIPNFSRIPYCAYFFNGASRAAQVLWPAAFLGMFSDDLYRYLRFPNEHYRLTLTDFLLGIPKNYNSQHASLSINLGGDIPTLSRLNYWPWTLVVGTILGSGLLNAMIGRKNFASLARDLQSGSTRVKARALFMVMLSTTYISFRDLEQLAIDIQQQSFLIKIAAIPLLADIAYYHPDQNVVDIADLSLRLLAFPQKAKGNPLVRLYAESRRWSIGRSESIPSHLLFYGLAAPFWIFAAMRLWSLIATKVIKLVQFERSRQACEAEEKSWRYIPERGDYDCTACDWDFVDYRSALRGQGCLDGLLSIPRNATEILIKLSTLASQSPFTTLDFSGEAWSEWVLSDWQAIMQLLQSPGFSGVVVFNVSQPASSRRVVMPNWLSAIADYLRLSQVQVADFSYVLMSEAGMAALLPGLESLPLRSVNFTGATITDTIGQSIWPLITSNSSLETVVLRDNLLTGESLPPLLDAVSESAVSALDLSQNSLNNTDLELLSEHLPLLNMTRLGLSGLDFRLVNMSRFGSGLAASHLTELDMDACQLSDSAGATLFGYVARSLIQRLNWAGNYLAFRSSQAIASGLQTSSLRELILDDNFIDDAGLASIGTAMAAGGGVLQRLSLSGNFYTSSGFIDFVATINGSSVLESLAAARTTIGDDGLLAVTVTLGSGSHLRELDVSAAGVTGVGADALFRAVPDSALTAIDLSHNGLEDMGSEALTMAFNGTRLQRLSLRDTQVAATTLQPALSVSPFSSLQMLDISDNAVGDAVMITLANTLVTIRPNQAQWLLSAADNIDFNRWLVERSPATALSRVVVENSNVTAVSARAVCLTLLPSGIATANLVLTSPQLLPGSTGVSGCPAAVADSQTLSVTSAAGTVSPNIIGMIVLALLLIRSFMTLGRHEGVGLLGGALMVYLLFTGESNSEEMQLMSLPVGAWIGYRTTRFFTQRAIVEFEVESPKAVAQQSVATLRK